MPALVLFAPPSSNSSCNMSGCSSGKKKKRKKKKEIQQRRFMFSSQRKSIAAPLLLLLPAAATSSRSSFVFRARHHHPITALDFHCIRIRIRIGFVFVTSLAPFALAAAEARCALHARRQIVRGRRNRSFSSLLWSVRLPPCSAACSAIWPVRVSS